MNEKFASMTAQIPDQFRAPAKGEPFVESGVPSQKEELATMPSSRMDPQSMLGAYHSFDELGVGSGEWYFGHFRKYEPRAAQPST
jgi:hypothetical protein